MVEATTEESTNETSQETLKEVLGNALNPSRDSDADHQEDSSTPESIDTDLDPDQSAADADLSQAGGEDAGVGEDDSTARGQDARIDKDPVFKRLHGENQKLKSDLAGLSTQIETVAKMFQGGQQGHQAGQPAEKPDYVDVTTLSEDDREDWRDKDAIGYDANLAKQSAAEATQRVLGIIDARSKENSVKSTFESFADKHEDFGGMLNSGQIKQFMAANPGHNLFSAYHELTLDNRLSKTAEGAAETAEKTAAQHQRAKGQQTIVNSRPAPKTSVDPHAEELQNTKKFGGKKATLARRLMRLRKADGR